MDLKETEILRDAIHTHWYYKSKAKALKKLIRVNPSIILDIGAGSGYFSKFLLKNTSSTEAWCVDIAYNEEVDTKENGKPIHYRKRIGSCNCDLVLLMDVLEHVDDDAGLLSEYVQKVSSGSAFIISVPAFPFMWSGHDEYLEHRRRYTLPQIEAVICNAGLVLENSAYYFGAVFPLAALSRLAGRMFKRTSRPQSQLKKHSTMVNSTLKAACDVELSFFQKNKVIGLTAFCMAHKP
jgi:SAM-dependent methyltransferase